jgi:hypothetical protein
MGGLLTLEQWMAGIHPQQFGQGVTYAAGSTDPPNSSRRVCGFAAPHYLARPWAVSLGAPSRTISSGAVGANLEVAADQRLAVALITWGTGGHMQTVELDYRQGSTVVVCGASVEVACRMPLAGTEPLRLSAQIAPAHAYAPTRVYRTLELGSIAFGTTVDATVPPYAIRVELLVGRGNPLTAIPYTLEWFRSDGTPIIDQYVPTTAAGSATFVAWVPLTVPTSADIVRVRNRGAAADMSRTQLIYELAL